MTELEALLRLGRRLEGQPDVRMAAAAALLRVRNREGRLRPLRANAAQRAFEARSGRENIVLKARQMGISTWVAGRFFLRTVTRPGSLTLHVAHTREAAEGLLQLVRRMWVELPEDLKAGPLRLGRSNAGQMVFPVLDSEIRVASAADENAGRGMSLQNLHCSEVSRWSGDAGATLAGLRAALAAGGGLVMESTRQGAQGVFYEAWCDAIEPSVADSSGRTLHAGMGLGDACGSPRETETGGVLRHFLPWWLETAYVGPTVPLEEMRAEESLLCRRHGLTGAQIGYRRMLERRYGTLRSQEFAEDAETCFRATGACCFELESIERRLAQVPEPALRRRNGAVEIWLPPVAGREYVVAADTAGGGAEGDFAAVQVVEVSTGLQCAELQERLRPAELARACAELAREYGGALVAVERNNHGTAVLAFLEMEQGYGRVYAQGGQAGWLTSAASKPEMVARLGVLLAESPARFMSRRLLGECRSFVADARGRAGAAPGAHDELVMAMAIAQAVRGEMLVRGVQQVTSGMTRR